MSRNIKEIGKELMGKSLNSFHRKTGLTQLEKNNEMQDGILDGILSQVDDAYIEKTEQSNVLHLDGSGDGVVVLDSIEGNTMVNLVPNSFRISHNVVGDYNWNAGLAQSSVVSAVESFSDRTLQDLKPNTEYTIICNVKSFGDNVGEYALNNVSGSCAFGTSMRVNKVGVHIFKRTTKSNLDLNEHVFALRTQNINARGLIVIEDIMILEGDYTDKDINYFKGLQSSFEEKVNDEDKYEIEILSQNRNLLSKDSWRLNESTLVSETKDEIVTKGKNNIGGGIRFILKNLKEGRYCFSISAKTNTQGDGSVRIYNETKKQYIDVHLIPLETSLTYKTGFFTIPKDYERDEILIWIGKNTKYELETQFTFKKDFMLTRVSTDVSLPYEEQKQNKIKLLLNSPLLKGDKLVVKDGKLQHYHKMKQMKITDRSQLKYMGTYPTNEGYLCKHFNLLNTEPPKPYTDCYCDNISVLIPKGDGYSALSYTPSLAIAYQGMLYVTAKISDYAEPIDYLLAKTPTIVYELAEPYYEEVLNEYGEPVMLEGYENGTVYIDSVITPTTTLRYTPKMESLKTLKAVNHNNIMLTDDINNNIIDYMMNVDLMIMEKEMQITKTRRIGEKDMTNMQKRTFDMLKRLIKGKTLTEQECKDRVVLYLSAEKITSEQAEELMLYISEIYS